MRASKVVMFASSSSSFSCGSCLCGATREVVKGESGIASDESDADEAEAAAEAEALNPFGIASARLRLCETGAGAVPAVGGSDSGSLS